jgi:hypothetical protein
MDRSRRASATASTACRSTSARLSPFRAQTRRVATLTVAAWIPAFAGRQRRAALVRSSNKTRYQRDPSSRPWRVS